MTKPHQRMLAWLRSLRTSVMKFIMWGGLAFLLYIAIILTHGTITDWQPASQLPLEAEQPAAVSMLPDSILSFVTWNIGYGGLGTESNFFFDHGYHFLSWGKMIRSPRSLVEKNIAGIRQFVDQTQSDFFLLQEVDVNSRRSYGYNEYQRVGEVLPGFYGGFAPNYRVRRVPVPLLEPWRAYGRTNSGLATFSRFQPATSERLQFPGGFGWPTRLFQLDRCLALHRFPVSEGRELVVVNIHLSAYDEDGSLKRQQMDFLGNLCRNEFSRGNFVIVGGDWNQCPPFFPFDKFMPGRDQGYSQYNIDPEFMSADWRWVYDPTMPTNRKIREKYMPGETFVTLIDFFLISPNVKVRTVRTLNQGFQFSDHQPVWMEVELEF